MLGEELARARRNHRERAGTGVLTGYTLLTDWLRPQWEGAIGLVADSSEAAKGSVFLAAFLLTTLALWVHNRVKVGSSIGLPDWESALHVIVPWLAAFHVVAMGEETLALALAASPEYNPGFKILPRTGCRHYDEV
jgi:hypothetical protein